MHTHTQPQALKAMLEKLTDVDVAIHVFAVCVYGRVQCTLCVCVYAHVSAVSMRVHAFAHLCSERTHCIVGQHIV